MPPYSAI